MTAPLVAVSVLLLLVGLSTAWYVQHLQHEAANVVALNVSSIRAAEELEIGLREIRNEIHQFLLTGDRRHLDAVPVRRLETDRWLNEARRLATTSHEQELMAAVGNGYARFLDQFQRFNDAGTDPDAQDELRRLVDDLLTHEILEPAQEYLEYNQQVIDTSSRRGQVMARRMVLGLLLLSTCGPVAGLLAGFVVARRVSRTLVELSVPVRDAAGKLSKVVGPITAAGRELDELPGLMQELAGQVSDVVQRLQQSQREVLRNEQLAAVGQLAAGVAHELRNPLQSIQLLVQSAVAEGDAGCLRGRDLAVLQEAVDRLKRSVQTFLDFARPPALERKPTELGGVVRQTVELVSGRASYQGVRMECHLPDRPLIVEADPDQMRQVVLNLLLNAIDAVAAAGTVKVDLRAPVSASQQDNTQTPSADGDEPSRWVTLAVTDDGCGLPADLGERIFEPFVTTKETGVGLGLAICRRIAEAHGGRLNAADGAAGGAVFTVQLPAVGGSLSTEAAGESPSTAVCQGGFHAHAAGN
jgi:signal transduction histidine kinase